MLNPIPRGAIYNEAAYAQGKMLDHRGWAGILRDKITPSDVDMVLDNHGSVAYCEIARGCPEWHDLGRGQRLSYEAHVQGSTRHCAVVCHHDVPTSRQIDTRRDITSFQIKIDAGDGQFITSPVYQGNEAWQRFVTKWINDPQGPADIRRHLLA